MTSLSARAAIFGCCTSLPSLRFTQVRASGLWFLSLICAFHRQDMWFSMVSHFPPRYPIQLTKSPDDGWTSHTTPVISQTVYTWHFSQPGWWLDCWAFRGKSDQKCGDPLLGNVERNPWVKGEISSANEDWNYQTDQTILSQIHK